MRSRRTVFGLLVLGLVLALAGGASVAQDAAPQTALGTAFTYQGRLQDAGGPVDGACDLRFKLYNAADGGTQIGATQTLAGVRVREGLFTVQIDFGAGAFNGYPRWLEIEVRCPAGTDSYVTLSPRQPLTPAPYALYAAQAPDTLSGLSCASGQVAKWNGSAWVCAEDLQGGGNGGSGGWSLTGNSGTTPGTHFLGTTDNKALELKVDGQRALRLEPNATSPNLIGGYKGNSVQEGVVGAVIAGGGLPPGCAIGIPCSNWVSDSHGTVGGGASNWAGDGDADPAGARFATVGGGYLNRASNYGATVGGGTGNAAGGKRATVGGGELNRASGQNATVGGGEKNAASADHATVGGGGSNTASADRATVGGGGSNTASGAEATVSGGIQNAASGDHATIGGGAENAASDTHATVAGGDRNMATRRWATVGGGSQNSSSHEHATVGGGTRNTASGSMGTVGGGTTNTASNWATTVAGGRQNTASGYEATVGGGSGNRASSNQATVGGGASNTASGRVSTVGGGSGNTASAYGATVPGGNGNLAQGAGSFAAGSNAKANKQGCFVWADSAGGDLACDNNDRWLARASGGVRFYTNGSATSGVKLDSGANAWSSASSRDLKENYEAVDAVALVEQLAAQVPVTTWNYKSEDPAIRHMGPVAEDFYAAFGLGGDGQHISTIDADGVALAAIQGLYQLVQEKDRLLADQAQQIAGLEARLAALEALVVAAAQDPEGGRP